MAIRRVFSGAEFEQKVGYCRAIACGPFVAVSGTTSLKPGGGVHAPGDAYAQARRCLEIIAAEMLIEIEADAIAEEHA